MRLVITLCFVLVAVAMVFFWWRRRRARGFGPLSIVMLRTKPRRFTDADIRSAYRRAFSREPELNRLQPDETTDAILLTGESAPPLAVIDSRRLYMEPEELEQVVAACEHPDARTGIQGHKAWVSVDAMGVDPSRISASERQMVYTLLGKLAAELIDDDCTLLYQPAEQRVGRPVPNAADLLRQGRAADLFSDDDLQAPIIHAEAGDEQINAAMAKAKQRLPEFISAWESRGGATEGMVKGRFQGDAGEVEYIWVKVTAMTDHGFRGTIENPPLDPSIPKKGSSVEVKLDDVVDWAYLDEKKRGQGLFVDRLLMKRR